MTGKGVPRLEQVGWRWYEPRPSPGWYFDEERPDWVPADPPEPVYCITMHREGLL